MLFCSFSTIRYIAPFMRCTTKVCILQSGRLANECCTPMLNISHNYDYKLTWSEHRKWERQTNSPRSKYSDSGAAPVCPPYFRFFSSMNESTGSLMSRTALLKLSRRVLSWVLTKSTEPFVTGSPGNPLFMSSVSIIMLPMCIPAITL